MGARSRWTKLNGTVLIAAVLCLVSAGSALPAQSHKSATPAQGRKKTKKPLPPPLPSGPTGPVQQIPLDSIAAVPPQVTFQNNQLTIVAPNSTLADILRAVRKQTGAEIDVPAAPERVVTKLGPGPAREVMAQLLNGSRFNYVLLGAPGEQNALTRVVLVAKTGAPDITPNNPQPGEPGQGMQQAGMQAPGVVPPVAFNAPQQEPPSDANEEPAEEVTPPDDNSNEQNGAEAEQPQENPGVKTPQQMLQEMQQRQLQLQQNQPPGQPPIPGSGMPPHPPQEQ
jgi:hypothetical protein